jgi:hypothetical protein
MSIQSSVTSDEGPAYGPELEGFAYPWLAHEYEFVSQDRCSVYESGDLRWVNSPAFSTASRHRSQDRSVIRRGWLVG